MENSNASTGRRAGRLRCLFGNAMRHAKAMIQENSLRKICATARHGRRLQTSRRASKGNPQAYPQILWISDSTHVLHTEILAECLEVAESDESG
jgi:hypothetical protein